MTSQIDITKPDGPIAYTQDVRDNFAIAAAEISALQMAAASGPYLPLAGGEITGSVGLGNPLPPQPPLPGSLFMTAATMQLDHSVAWNAYNSGGLWYHYGVGPSTTLGVDPAGVFNVWHSPDAPADALGTWGITFSVAPDGTVTTQGPVVLPADPAGAMEAVTKQYADALPFLPLAGGTMLGMLTLAADPVNALDAATMQFVQAATAGGPFLPLVGGNLSGNLTIDDNYSTLQVGASSGNAVTIRPGSGAGSIARLATTGTGGLQLQGWVAQGGSTGTSNATAANLFVYNVSMRGGYSLLHNAYISTGTGRSYYAFGNAAELNFDGTNFNLAVYPSGSSGAALPTLASGLKMAVTPSGIDFSAPLTVGTSGANNAVTVTPGATVADPIAFAQSGTGGFSFDGPIALPAALNGVFGFGPNNIGIFWDSSSGMFAIGMLLADGTGDASQEIMTFNYTNCLFNAHTFFEATCQFDGNVSSNADFSFNGGVGFFGALALSAAPTVTGSRGGNAALASLLTALASYGLITDSTTA